MGDQAPLTSPGCRVKARPWSLGRWEGPVGKDGPRVAGLEEGGVGWGVGRGGQAWGVWGAWGELQEGGWWVGPGLRRGGPSGPPKLGICSLRGRVS